MQGTASPHKYQPYYTPGVSFRTLEHRGCHIIPVPELVILIHLLEKKTKAKRMKNNENPLKENAHNKPSAICLATLRMAPVSFIPV